MKEKIKVLLPEAEVDKKIQELGEQISKDYEGKSIHMICVFSSHVNWPRESVCLYLLTLCLYPVMAMVRHLQVRFVS